MTLHADNFSNSGGKNRCFLHWYAIWDYCCTNHLKTKKVIDYDTRKIQQPSGKQGIQHRI